MFFSTSLQSEGGSLAQTWLHACVGNHMEIVPQYEPQIPLDSMILKIKRKDSNVTDSLCLDKFMKGITIWSVLSVKIQMPACNFDEVAQEH